MLWCCLSLILSVRLNFKAIASMEFNLISNSVYYVHMMVVCSWKTIENCFRKILENSSFMCFDRSKIGFDQLSETVTILFNSIDFRLLVDRSNVLFRSIEQQSSTNRVRPIVWYEFLIFLTDRKIHSINWKLWILNFSKCFQV